MAALGTDAGGQIVPPVGTVQWYTGSVVPGQTGAAVIAGHVTSPRPDVFYRLSELVPGDLCSVRSRNGDMLDFEIARTKRVSKQDLTRDATVWGDVPHRTLVLITCDDRSPVRNSHYTRNFVAWARLRTD